MIQILYENGPVVVVAKPAGLSTQAPRGIDCLERRLRSFLHSRFLAQNVANSPSSDVRFLPNGELYLGVPHRLDRPVSGAVLFTTTKRAARRISKQFERRQVEKVYWACLEGRPSEEEATWKDYLHKVPDEARAELVQKDDPRAEEAILAYRTVGSWSGGTWLEIRLGTGRYHQIRLQAASRGTPIAGDLLYGAALTFGPRYGDDRLTPIALHARELAFTHPINKVPVRVVAPLPHAWGSLGLVDGVTGKPVCPG